MSSSRCSAIHAIGRGREFQQDDVGVLIIDRRAPMSDELVGRAGSFQHVRKDHRMAELRAPGSSPPKLRILRMPIHIGSSQTWKL